MRVIALTGVPGTGKTTVAEHLAERYTVLQAREVARRADAIEGSDLERGAEIIDEQRLDERARSVLPDEDVIVEGVLAHHCDPDAVILLRCHPTELGRRLAQRDWSQDKVEENVMAETLDALVLEITTQPAWEIDTTQTDPATVSEHIVALLQDEPLPGDAVQAIGTADWTDTLLGGDEG